MSNQYFPPAYFTYVIFGSNLNPGTGGADPSNWLTNILKKIANSLASLFEINEVLILADIGDASVVPISSMPSIMISPKSLRTCPVADASAEDLSVVMTSEVRIRFLSAADDAMVEVLGAVSNVVKELTANDFDQTCIGPRSRLAGHQIRRISQDVYELSFTLETQSVV
jgi:hypothetical protein